MKNTWISFLIVLSIALQSFFAVANSNESHQVDYQHLQTEHSHDGDTHKLYSKISGDEHDINDCHHCGHCQGSHTPWFVSKKESESTPALIVLNQYLYHSHLTNSFIEEPIRPPIV